MSFREATSVTRVSDETFEATIPDQWQQGRGAFGGIVFGTVLRAACAAEVDPERRVRTFACDVAGPLQPGKVEVRVHTLRRGRSQTNMQLTLTQQGEVIASGLCTLSTERPLEDASRATAHVPPAPAEALSDPSALRVLPDQTDRGGPMFAKHYEYRTTGPLPFRGGPEPINAGFVRERDATGELDAPAVVALLDSFWPALFTVLPRGSRMLSTTASFNAQLMHLDAPIPADEPLFFRGRSVHQSHGFNVEFRELWCKDRLIGLNQQTFVILR
jgi:acyl-coenzyme A thioesterase PaaI-like protein